MTDVTENLAQIRTRITRAALRYGRDPHEIHLIAVSKRQPAQAIRVALQAGQRDFGENYLQEAEAKISELGATPAVWHFIGRIQSNKTQRIASGFDWVHTIERLRIAERLNEQRRAAAPRLQVCIQVEVSGDAARAGVQPPALARLARAIDALPRLQLRGLMCMPPPSSELETQRRYFRRLKDCQEVLRAEGLALDVLSAGMSGDLEAAIAEGATHLRVGTAVFGPRPR